MYTESILAYFAYILMDIFFRRVVKSILLMQKNKQKQMMYLYLLLFNTVLLNFFSPFVLSISLSFVTKLIN